MDWENDSVGGNSQRAPRLSDLCETVDFRDGKPHTLRPVGPALRVARHWITTKSKEGKKNKPFPKICLGYNSKTGEFDGECPYCEAGIRASIEVHQNVIDRDAQEDGPPKKAGDPTKTERKEREFLGYTGYFKDSIETKVWTPVKVAVLGTSPALKVKDTVAVNKVKGKDGTKKTYPPQHPKYGYDLVITYHDDKKRAATDRYSVVKDERNALSEEELDYHLWFLGLEKPEKLKVAQEEMSRLKKRLWKEDGEEDDDEDDEDKPKKKKRHQEEDDDFGDRKSSKSKKRSRDDDDDDDEDDEDRPKSKKRSSDWDDEDEDEDDDDKPKKKSSKSKRRDGDEDEDEDEEEDDRPKKKKRSRDDDEDEEDEPKRKKSSKRRSSDDEDDDEEDDDRPAKKKKRSRDDDDDEEDDDKPRKKRRSREDDEDEDEDDRPKKKKRSRDDEDDEDDDKPKKKSSKKRSLKDADDEDDDWDEDGDD